MTRYESNRAWLSQHRTQGMAWGVILLNSCPAQGSPAQALRVGAKGSAASARISEDHRLALFERREDRDAFRDSLPEGTWEPDPKDPSEDNPAAPSDV